MKKLETRIKDEFHQLILTEALKFLHPNKRKNDTDQQYLKFHIYIVLHSHNLISVKEFMTKEMLNLEWDFGDIDELVGSPLGSNVVNEMMDLYFTNPTKYQLFAQNKILYCRGTPFEYNYLETYLGTANITLENFKKCPRELWNAFALNPHMTDKFIEDNPDIEFDYLLLSANQSISWDFIIKHSDKKRDWVRNISGWDWEILMWRPDCSLDFIFQHIDLPWDWWVLTQKILRSNHPVYNKKYIIEHPHLKWEIKNQTKHYFDKNTYTLSLLEKFHSKYYGFEFEEPYSSNSNEYHFEPFPENFYVKIDNLYQKKIKSKNPRKIDMDLIKSRITPEMASNPLVKNIIKVLEEKKTEKEILENENITLEFIKTFQELTQLKLRWYLYPLTFEKEKELIRKKHYRRFLAARKIEKWWIKVNWDPRYARCQQRLNKDYDSLFISK